MTSTLAGMTAAFCSAKPASRIDSRWAGPILLYVELRALFELLVDDRTVQFRGRNEDPLQLVMVRKRVLRAFS